MITCSKPTTARFGPILGIALMAALAVACARKPYVPVQYQMPPAEKVGKGQQIYLTLADQPALKTVFSARARKAAKYQSDHLALVVGDAGSDTKSLGTMSPDTLLLEAMTQRVQQLGYTVCSVADTGCPTVALRLDRFAVDYVKKNWTIEIAYTVTILRDGAKAVSQSMRATGERRKLLGNKELEVLIGEIFTDAVNRLDLAALMNVK